MDDVESLDSPTAKLESQQLSETSTVQYAVVHRPTMHKHTLLGVKCKKLSFQLKYDLMMRETGHLLRQPMSAKNTKWHTHEPLSRSDRLPGAPWRLGMSVDDR